MFKRSCIAVAAGALSLWAIGCDLLGSDEDSLWLVDANADRAVLSRTATHHPSNNGTWLVQLATGKATHFKAARSAYDLQAVGDYYVCELPTGLNHVGRVVAGQFSTGDEWTLLMRDLDLDGSYWREFVLDGERVVWRTSDSLVAYSLSQRATLKTVPLAEPAVAVLAIGGKYALISLDESHRRHALVNLDDGTASEISAPTDGFLPAYDDAALSDTAMITTASTSVNAGEGRDGVLILDLPGLTWRVLADYGDDPDITGWSDRGLAVRGADEQVVLVSVISDSGPDSVELIDRQTGERTAVPGFPSEYTHAILSGGKVYWLGASQDKIKAFDMSTHETTSFEVDLSSH